MSVSRRDFVRSASAAALVRLTPEDIGAPAPASGRVAPSFVHAHPVRLDRVRLTGGPLKKWQDADAAYLLSLDPDRMTAYYRTRAGLKQKAEPYAGWDGDGRNLTGHIAGHHLSAVSLMYQATGDARFKQRADYLVRELAEVQKKNGDGYLSGLENGREAFAKLSKGEIHSAAFDLNGLWSPWYTLHKTFAGLRDAYRHTGNETALGVETKFAGWAERTLAPLDDAQIARMLNTEHGGMNEVLADLYADTGDERWLALSYRFEHHAFTDALKRHQDNLNGKHGNCQIPKLVGSAARYSYTGDPGDLLAADFFWDRVVQHHSYATGGHGLAEYFGPADVLGARVDGRTCESCNVYNMLKLTRRLFSIRSDAFYADFQERALFNHALASFDPDGVRMSYMVPVGRATQQEYQDMQRSFTCCVGTGMENHALHGDGIYYESARRGEQTLWVTMFVPSTAELSDGTRVRMESEFPEGERAKLTFVAAGGEPFTLSIRRPSWAGDGFRVAVNGVDVPQPALASLAAGAAGGRDVPHDDRFLPPSTFVEVKRAWKAGDIVELTLPKTLRLERTPDDPTINAIMWGPLVLAGDLGARRETRVSTDDDSAELPSGSMTAPVLVAGGRPVEDWVSATGDSGDFEARQVAQVPSAPGSVGDVKLAPFYRTQERTYSVYFDVVTPEQFAEKVDAVKAERERVRRLNAATVGVVQLGDAVSEKAANYQSEPAKRALGRTAGRGYRAGSGWLSVELPVDSSAAMALVVTYYNELGIPPAAGRFDLLVDGTVVGSYQPNEKAREFFDTIYQVPASVTAGKSRVTVRVEGTRIVPIFAIRTVRGGEL